MKLNNESLKSFEQAKTFSEHASKVNDSAKTAWTADWCP